MSLFPFEKLHYAETHFKFKLPWSILFRPWPEILVDAPFQFVPGVQPSLWIVIRDAHRFPTKIQKLEVEIIKENLDKATLKKTETFTLKFSKELNIVATQQFEFHLVELDFLEPGFYKVNCKVFAQRIGQGKFAKQKVFNRWNYPYLKSAPLKFQILKDSPPKAPGFVAGEMHCHTHYSADHVEHGASPKVLQQGALAVGLDFVNLTDHAYDFVFETNDYTKEADSPLVRFEDLKKEVSELLLTPLMVVSEEVSAGNSKGENVHVLTLEAKDYLPGLGDCGRNWLNNQPTKKLKSVIRDAKTHCFAAHPMQQMSALEKFIFRRGYWTSEDLNGLRGIQFWNGLKDEGFYLGRELWIKELGVENYLLPIGGNDAHGDLNDQVAVHLPLISLKHSREHIFGNVRTVVKLPENFDKKNDAFSRGESAGACSLNIIKAITSNDLKEAFDGFNCYITDGPALWWELDLQNKNVTFFAKNTDDFGGGFRYIKIYGRRRLLNGKLLQKEELHLASQVAAPKEISIKIPLDDFAYLRGECETATGKFALTSAAHW